MCVWRKCLGEQWIEWLNWDWRWRMETWAWDFQSLSKIVKGRTLVGDSISVYFCVEHSAWRTFHLLETIPSLSPLYISHTTDTVLCTSIVVHSKSCQVLRAESGKIYSLPTTISCLLARQTIEVKTEETSNWGEEGATFLFIDSCTYY